MRKSRGDRRGHESRVRGKKLVEHALLKLPSMTFPSFWPTPLLLPEQLTEWQYRMPGSILCSLISHFDSRAACIWRTNGGIIATAVSAVPSCQANQAWLMRERYRVNSLQTLIWEEHSIVDIDICGYRRSHLCYGKIHAVEAYKPTEQRENQSRSTNVRTQRLGP